jgi:hypothetical protein
MSDNTVVLIDEGLEAESIVNLDDMAEESGGAWPIGWYAADVIEGYATNKGKQFQTADTVSQDGESRNVRLCFRVKRGDQERTMQQVLNYRTSDFTSERIAHIKVLRDENRNTKGKWADGNAQRSSLAMAKMGGFTKALGQSLKLAANGAVIVTPFLNQSVDVYLAVDDKGYNEVKHFEKAGTKVKR